MSFQVPDHKILLYHGTIRPHKYPSYRKGKHFTDFGQGYYVTSIPFQAQDWVWRKAPRKYWVYEYAFQPSPEISVLLFPEYDKEWLNFITDCRLPDPNFPKSRSKPFRYDVIVGGLADSLRVRPRTPNEQTLPDLLGKYQRGKVGFRTVLDKIRPRKDMDQFCFRSDAAVSLLRRTRGWQWEYKYGGWVREDAPVFDDKRIDLLAAMYARITGDTKEEAKAGIMKTMTGKAIAHGSEACLYDQPTHNLEEIAEELSGDIRGQFTWQAIQEAFLAEEEERERTKKQRRAFVPFGTSKEDEEEKEDDPEEPVEADDEDEKDSEPDEPESE